MITLQTTYRKLVSWLRKNPFALSVVLHVALLLFSLFLPAKNPSSPKPKMNVQTVQLFPQKLPEKKTAPATTKKTIPPKKVPSSSKKPPQKKLPKPSANKVEKKKSTAVKKIPEKKSPLQKKATDQEKNIAYLFPETSQLSLMQLLKNQLELPEIGKVTLELTLTAKGAVKEAKILSSESKKNAAYLMRALDKISFSDLKLTNEITIILEFGNVSSPPESS